MSLHIDALADLVRQSMNDFEATREDWIRAVDQVFDQPALPSGFWPQIDHQLNRIASEKPDTFDQIREILLDSDYDAIVAEVNRNGTTSFDTDSAFFAGSGGEATFEDVLRAAGWMGVLMPSSYFYLMQHPATGAQITYTEGDVHRGNRLGEV